MFWWFKTIVLPIGNKMGFNPAAGLGMAMSERMLVPDKLHVNSMNSGMAPEPGNPFQNMPFFLPSLNNGALQNMAGNNMNSMATGERGSSLHPSHCPVEPAAKQRGDPPTTNRNSNNHNFF